MTPIRSGSSEPDAVVRVQATEAALQVIERLEDAHGRVVFFQSGGCCDGTRPMCLKAEELLPTVNDRLLGEIGGADFYIDADQDERWGRPRFVIDVRPGAGDGFSLEGAEGVHFVVDTPGPAAE